MITEILPKTSTNEFGFLILKPEGYSASTAYPLGIFIHGNGNRGNGSLASLQQFATQIPSELKASIDKYKMVLVCPQYDNPDTSCIDHVLSYASANLMYDVNRVILTAFSLGGRVITDWVTKSQQNADKISLLVNVAGLNGLNVTGIKYIHQSNLPTLFFHATNDDQANVSNTNNAVAAINTNNPGIKAVAILYSEGKHYIENMAYSSSKYAFVGNVIPNTLWDYALMFTKSNPTALPVSDGPVKPIAISADFITESPSIKLIGNLSRNCNKGIWSVVAVPDGINRYSVNACAWIDCDLTLPGEGKYIFKLTVMDTKGQTDTKDITVTYSKGTIPEEPVKKTVKAINHIGFTLYFTDGTTAQAVSAITDLSTGKTTYKVSDKEEYII